MGKTGLTISVREAKAGVQRKGLVCCTLFGPLGYVFLPGMGFPDLCFPAVERKNGPGGGSCYSEASEDLGGFTSGPLVLSVPTQLHLERECQQCGYPWTRPRVIRCSRAPGQATAPCCGCGSPHSPPARGWVSANPKPVVLLQLLRRSLLLSKVACFR